MTPCDIVHVLIGTSVNRRSLHIFNHNHLFKGCRETFLTVRLYLVQVLCVR